MDTGDEFHHPLALAGWHPDAAALRYAPGYFATGAVQGYSIDALAMARPALAAGHRRATGRGVAEAA